MKAVESSASEIIKEAIAKAKFSSWRQVGIRGAEDPPIIVIEIDGVTHVVASSVAFGSGHLSGSNWWQEGGHGAIMRPSPEARPEIGKMEAADEHQIPGFIHFHRSITKNALMIAIVQPGSPEDAANKFFREKENEGEYSVFIHVLFAKSDGKWRATPPPSGQ